MRSETLLKLTVAVVLVAGAIVLGWSLFTSYWGDVRMMVAYQYAQDAVGRADKERAAMLRDAQAIDPGNWLVALRLGEQALFRGDLATAERQLDVSLQGNSASPLANYTMGVVQYRLGSIDAALPYFAEAVRLDPGNRQYEGMVKQLRAARDSGAKPPASP